MKRLNGGHSGNPVVFIFLQQIMKCFSISSYLLFFFVCFHPLTLLKQTYQEEMLTSQQFMWVNWRHSECSSLEGCSVCDRTGQSPRCIYIYLKGTHGRVWPFGELTCEMWPVNHWLLCCFQMTLITLESMCQLKICCSRSLPVSTWMQITAKLHSFAKVICVTDHSKPAYIAYLVSFYANQLAVR